MTEPAGPDDDAALDALLRAYVDFHVDEDSEAGRAHLAAAERIWEMTAVEPERCWRLIERARAAGLTMEQLAFVSAGPFEDLLGRYGPSFIGRVEAAAASDDALRFMLATVWRGAMDDATWGHVETIRARLGIMPL